MKYITTTTVIADNQSTVRTQMVELDDDDFDQISSSAKVREHEYYFPKLQRFEVKLSADSMKIISNVTKVKQTWKEIAERCQDPVATVDGSFEDFVDWLKAPGFDNTVDTSRI